MLARSPVLILAAAAAVSPAAFAHHSFAPHFDASRPVTIIGTVSQFEARNPHAYLHVIALDANGRSHEYRCESHGITQLERNGVSPELLAPGTKVTVRGSQARRDPYGCFFTSVTLADGHVLDVNGTPTLKAAETKAEAALPKRHDIFGKWLLVPAGRSTSGPQPMMKYLTPAGKAAVAKYDPFKDDPTFRCNPVAIRRVWFAPDTPLEIERDGDRVI
ncbi:MAG TPA: DUF6152 family protein, partial [Gammaproteobacteria bacterium]|nr:DUF6152 family protein [Gammaproteobacteria bacterium]